MHLVDSHCHLHTLELGSETVDQIIHHATEQSIKTFLCVAIDLNDIAPMRAIAARHDNVYISVGVHPNEVKNHEPSVDELCQLAADSRVVALGETGLDYFRSEPGEQEQQKRALRTHIVAAKQLKKPLIIHMRDADDDLLSILAAEKADEIGGVMHCFTSTEESAKRAMDLGFSISFSGIVTFKNAKDLQAVAKIIPDDFLLIETDAPYLAPTPYRGKPNVPAYLIETAKFLADLRGQSLKEIAEITTRNFARLFLADRRN